MNILGIDYKVIETDPNSEVLGSGDFAGRVDFQHQIIYVSSDLSEDMKKTTIIHEVIEALNYHLEMNLNHRNISALEAGLYQFLKSNNIDISSLLDQMDVIKELEFDND